MICFNLFCIVKAIQILQDLSGKAGKALKVLRLAIGIYSAYRPILYSVASILKT